jgi:catechol 2,3-dioxygenase-like lactoylglutathione lyase family enzyme
MDTRKLESARSVDWNSAGTDAVNLTAHQQVWAMDELATVEIKAFVPSKDFALCKQFYQHLGFELAWSSDDLAYFRDGNSSFLLQNFYEKEHADNFMMHLLVEDVQAWCNHVQVQELVAKYGVRVEPPADRPWGIRDFVIIDPTGVLWRIGQNIGEPTGEIA